MEYPDDKAAELEEYVFKRFGSSLSNSDWHLYSGIHRLERKLFGFCNPVIAAKTDFADAAKISDECVTPGFQNLQSAGVLTWEPGEKRVKGKPARSTRIRRFTLEELKIKSTEGEGAAETLARELKNQSSQFEGRIIAPLWSVNITGKVQSSKPNIQGFSSDRRRDGLQANLSAGMALVECDIIRAEPTLVLHLLGMDPARDLYKEFSDATGLIRDVAKRALNKINYHMNSSFVASQWPPAAQAALADYVNGLLRLQADLRIEADNHGRSISTLTGRRITARAKKDRLHNGIPLCWRVAGTIADVINAAALNLLPEVKVLVPVSDCLYCITPADKTGIVEAAIVAEIRKLRLPLHVKTRTVPAKTS